MKSKGIVRSLDTLGRVVLPIEMRRALDLGDNAQLEITAKSNCIILKKHETSCVFCGALQNLNAYRGKMICEDCARKIGAL